MGHGTLEAKLLPIVHCEEVINVYVVRKEKGPNLNKVRYFVLPLICKFGIFNLLITPIYLVYYILKLRPDFIIAYHFIPYAIFACISGTFTNTPYIISQTGLIIHDQAKRVPFSWIIRTVTTKAAFIHVPGTTSKEKWIRFGIDERKINILHSAIDVNRFKAIRIEKEYDFIFVGVFYEVKQIHLIIEAFQLIYKRDSSLKLLLVGDGNLMAQLRNQVNILGLTNNVFFSGFRKDTEILLNKSKIFIMASKTEGLPCALMEAMACELMVIVPDIGNLSDIVKSNMNGILVNNLDINSLTDKMKFALSHYNETNEMRKNARKIIVEEHSIEIAAKKWKSVFFRMK